MQAMDCTQFHTVHVTRGKMALDDATTQFLRQMSAPDAKPIHEMTPREARALGALLREMYGPGPDVGSVQEVTPGPRR